MPRLLILTAVLPEAQAIARALHLQPHKYAPNAWQNKPDLLLQVIGIRATKLPPITDTKAILLAGLAGALSPTLRIGDIVIDGNLHNLTSSFPYTPGRITTSAKIIATPAEKRSLFEKTNCLAVDMETEVVRQFALTHNAAFLALRTISDTAEDSLDPAMLNLVDDIGKPRISRAMGMLCAKPWKLKRMLRLKRNADIALKNLGNAVAKIVDAGWPGAKENATR